MLRLGPTTHSIQMRLTTPTALIIVFITSFVFANHAESFSPHVAPLKVRQRLVPMDKPFTPAPNSDEAMFSFNENTDFSLRRKVTILRGGFILPELGSNLLSPIGVYLIGDFLVGFLLSVFTRSHLHLDLVGTGVFAVAAIPNVLSSVDHIRWSSIAIVLWGSKLALFLFFRATQVKYDNRLLDLLSSSEGAFQFWFVTFLWNVIASLPYILGLNCDRDNSTTLFCGATLYFVGFLIETVADAQKYFFKQQHVAKEIPQFCNVGLWKYSQHPNWFGNLLLWTGIFLMNLPALLDPLSQVLGVNSEESSAGVVMRIWGLRKLILGSLGPVFLWVLFSGQASGNITNAVELAKAKYEKNPEYAKYIENVPLIFPRLSSN